MATYYVAVDGDDGDGGGAGDPWATPEHAIAAVAAGDTVYYGDGVYNCPNAGLTNWTDGSSGNVITHQATNSRQVTWQAVATPTNNRLLEMSNVDYVTLNGIVIDCNDLASRPVYMDNSTHITLDDVEITDSDGHGVDLEGDCEDITIIRCEVHTEYYNTGEFGNAILVNGADNLNLIIEDTQVYHSDHTGIDINSGVDGLTIKNCIVRDNHSHNISIGTEDGSDFIENAVIEDCIIYGAENWGDPEPGDVHTGIWLKDTVDTMEIRRCEIYDNDGPGIMISDRQNDNINIYNNTLYGNSIAVEAAGQGEIYLTGPDDTTPTINIKNNIFYATENGRPTLYSYMDESNVTLDYNCHYSDDAMKIRRDNGNTYTNWANYQAGGFEPNSIYDNPDMTDPANADFTLTGGSPCIDAGDNVGLPFYGTAPDMGANESGASPPAVAIVVVVTVVTTVIVVVIA